MRLSIVLALAVSVILGAFAQGGITPAQLAQGQKVVGQAQAALDSANKYQQLVQQQYAAGMVTIQHVNDATTAVAVAEAQLSAAKDKLAEVQAGTPQEVKLAQVAQARDAIDQAHAVFAGAQKDLAFIQVQFNAGTATDRQVNDAATVVEVAEAQVSVAMDKLAEVQAVSPQELKQAKLAEAQDTVALAQAGLDGTTKDLQIVQQQFAAGQATNEQVNAATTTVTEVEAVLTAAKDKLAELQAGTQQGAPTAPWPMFHINMQHTGRSPHNGPATSAQKWAFTTGADVWSSPTVGADGTVYVGSYDNNLYAVNTDGTKKWAFATGDKVVSSAAIGADGTVYVGSFDKKLYAINADGTQKWAFTTGGQVRSSPALGADGTVYVGSYDKKLYAINADGTQKWAFVTGGYIFSSPAIGADGTLYVGSNDNKLYAINPDGTQKWAFSTGGYVFSSPAIGADGTVYVGSPDGKLYAINPDGTQKWAFTTGNVVQSSPAIGADGTIYVGSCDNKLYAINPDGTQKWAFNTEDVVNSSPAIGADRTIYVGSDDHHLYAINPDGTQKWAFATGGILLSSPAIGADGAIYVGSFDGKLYAIGASAPFAIIPPTATLAPGATQQFAVNVPDRVIWKAGGGKIDANGLFTAGTVPGVYTVIAALGNKEATATVTITAQAP